MFQAWFSRSNAAETLDSYNQRLGRPRNEVRRGILPKTRAILKSRRWSEYFNELGVVIGGDDVDQLLRFAVYNSSKKGYHRSSYMLPIGYLKAPRIGVMSKSQIAAVAASKKKRKGVIKSNGRPKVSPWAKGPKGGSATNQTAPTESTTNSTVDGAVESVDRSEPGVQRPVQGRPQRASTAAPSESTVAEPVPSPAVSAESTKHTVCPPAAPPLTTTNGATDAVPAKESVPRSSQKRASAPPSVEQRASTVPQPIESVQTRSTEKSTGNAPIDHVHRSEPGAHRPVRGRPHRANNHVVPRAEPSSAVSAQMTTDALPPRTVTDVASDAVPKRESVLRSVEQRPAVTQPVRSVPKRPAVKRIVSKSPTTAIIDEPKDTKNPSKMSGILTVPVLRRGMFSHSLFEIKFNMICGVTAGQNVYDLSTIKRRLGVSPPVQAPGHILRNQHTEIVQTVPFKSSSGSVQYRRTIRLVDRQSMNFVAPSSSGSTWTLRGNGYGVCSGGIWSDEHFQCIQDKAYGEVDNVNVSETSSSADTPNEDVFSEQSTLKPKRRRNRRRRRRKD